MSVHRRAAYVCRKGDALGALHAYVSSAHGASLAVSMRMPKWSPNKAFVLNVLVVQVVSAVNRVQVMAPKPTPLPGLVSGSGLYSLPPSWWVDLPYELLSPFVVPLLPSRGTYKTLLSSGVRQRNPKSWAACVARALCLSDHVVQEHVWSLRVPAWFSRLVALHNVLDIVIATGPWASPAPPPATGRAAGRTSGQCGGRPVALASTGGYPQCPSCVRE